MHHSSFAEPCTIRSNFSAAMSAMYSREVPAYYKLGELVRHINAAALRKPGCLEGPELAESLDRLSEERHGAIRLGLPSELAMMRRVLAVMGMQPVGYYDLSATGLPIHSTGFRPTGEEELRRNPFRLFTSLLRLDLIGDAELRGKILEVLQCRQIFTPRAIDLTVKAESQGGLTEVEADEFVREVIETFRWHDRATVDWHLYERLNGAHRLLADIVAFRGPHINHLTPRTLDIDRSQDLLGTIGAVPKAVIEGPPKRKCPILLRQTSFRALDEPVSFRDGTNGWLRRSHTARFGEIEQRGIALTPKGRFLYDALLARASDGMDAQAHPLERQRALIEAFIAFPDSWDAIRSEGLGYFRYTPAKNARRQRFEKPSLEQLLATGAVSYSPITYEDFLPVSAAGIFMSNLGGTTDTTAAATPNRHSFQQALGCAVIDEFDCYDAIERASIDACLSRFASSSVSLSRPNNALFAQE